jgi:hypothetical protein
MTLSTCWRFSSPRSCWPGRSGDCEAEDEGPAPAKLATAFQVVFSTTSAHVDTDTGEIAPPEVETLEAINMHGRHSFKLPDLPGGLRSLRDQDATDE